METSQEQRVWCLLRLSHICARLAVAYATLDLDAIGFLLDQFQVEVDNIKRITPLA